MKNRSRYVCLTVVFVATSLSNPIALAGAAYDKAMAIVHNGESISSTGDLDAAMAEYARVEELYPEEFEAIAWARFRIAECLIAGWRWGDAREALQPVWNMIREGKIDNPDAKFWCAHRYAKCLSRTEEKWYLAQVARKALDVYETYATPGAGMEEAAGWLNYWRAQHFCANEQYVWAREAAQAAWEIGKNVKNGTLAAWSRLLMADGLRGEGNLLLARQILDECDDRYAPHEGSVYRLYLHTSKAETKLDLGLAEDTRQDLMSALEGELGDAALRIRAALVYADDAIQRGATTEALGPLAVIKYSLRHVPLWGDQADERWERIRGRVPPEAFGAALSQLAAATTASACERAALKLALGEMEVVKGQNATASSLLDEAERLAEDKRYDISLRLLRALSVSDTTPEAKQQEIEALIAEKNDSPAFVEHLLGRIRAKIAVGIEGATAYATWLDSHQAILPRNIYLVEKGHCLRRNRDLQGALSLADEALASADTWNRFEAHVDRIVALYLMRRDAEAERAVEAFLNETPDQGQRDYGLFKAGDAVRDRYPAGALALLDRVIASPAQGVWWQEAMMDKGYLLAKEGKIEEARAVLEQLAAHSPLEGNGGESLGVSLVLLAKLHGYQYGDFETAKGYFDQILDAGESMRFAQSYAYREYVTMLQRNKDLNGILTVCDRGLQDLPYTAEVDRGLLRFWRCDAQYQQGNTQQAISAAESLLDDEPPEIVRTKVENWLSQINGEAQ